MLEALPCGVVVTTLDGIIRQSNQEFLQWVGESGKVGQPLAGVFTLGSRLFYETNLAPIVHLQGRVDEAVAELRMPDGARMSALLNIREWKGEPDSEPGLLIVVFPANERRRYERELLAAERQSRETAVALRKAREAAEAANEAKTRFLTNMSHELRTPLNGILGFAGLLHDSPLSHPQREYVETIQQSGEGLLDIISDLLDLARVTSGRMELENVAVELQKVMTGVCDLVTPRLIDTSTKLTIEWDNSLPQYLWGDPGRIRQILLNLVGNAIKFTEAGTVTVHARRADPGIVRIEVADSGPGIGTGFSNRSTAAIPRSPCARVAPALGWRSPANSPRPWVAPLGWKVRWAWAPSSGLRCRCAPPRWSRRRPPQSPTNPSPAEEPIRCYWPRIT
jgi:signal transduction histidine kinase